MSIFSGILIFILVWWMAFFCALPFRIESSGLNNDGNMPGAPAQAHVKGKAIIATLIAIAVWLMIYAVVKANLISFHDIARQMPV